MTFGKRLRTMREGMGWEQKRLAQSLEVSPQHVCDLESGRRAPSVNLVDRLCDWIGGGYVEWHRAGARAHGWKVSPMDWR